MGAVLGEATVAGAFLGNYEEDSVVVIDPSEAPYFTLVEVPHRRVDFILDPARPQFAYVLAEDGTLYRVNLLSAEAEQSAKVVQAYSMDGHWRDPRPILSSPTGTVSTKGRTWDATMRPSL